MVFTENCGANAPFVVPGGIGRCALPKGHFEDHGEAEISWSTRRECGQRIVGVPGGSDGYRLGAGICTVVMVNSQEHEGVHRDSFGMAWTDEVSAPAAPPEHDFPVGQVAQASSPYEGSLGPSVCRASFGDHDGVKARCTRPDGHSGNHEEEADGGIRAVWGKLFFTRNEEQELGRRFAEQTGGHPDDAPDPDDAFAFGGSDTVDSTGSDSAFQRCDSHSDIHRCIMPLGHSGAHHDRVKAWTGPITPRGKRVLVEAGGPAFVHADDDSPLTPTGIQRLLVERNRQIGELQLENISLKNKLNSQSDRQTGNAQETVLIKKLEQEIERLRAGHTDEDAAVRDVVMALEKTIEDQAITIEKLQSQSVNHRAVERMEEAERSLKEFRDIVLERDNVIYERGQEIAKQRGVILSLRGGVALIVDHLAAIDSDFAEVYRALARAREEVARIQTEGEARE